MDLRRLSPFTPTVRMNTMEVPWLYQMCIRDRSGRHSVPSLHIYLQGPVAGQGGSVDSLFLFHFKGLGFHGDAHLAYREKGAYADGYVHAAVILGVR